MAAGSFSPAGNAHLPQLKIIELYRPPGRDHDFIAAADRGGFSLPQVYALMVAAQQATEHDIGVEAVRDIDLFELPEMLYDVSSRELIELYLDHTPTGRLRVDSVTQSIDIIGDKPWTDRLSNWWTGWKERWLPR